MAYIKNLQSIKFLHASIFWRVPTLELGIVMHSCQVSPEVIYGWGHEITSCNKTESLPSDQLMVGISALLDEGLHHRFDIRQCDRVWSWSSYGAFCSRLGSLRSCTFAIGLSRWPSWKCHIWWHRWDPHATELICKKKFELSLSFFWMCLNKFRNSLSCDHHNFF